MFPFLSVITAVKDYVEIVHKLVETNSTTFSSNGSILTSYFDFGSIITYTILFIKDLLNNLFTFSWLNNLSSLPIIIPNVASSMISEVSVLNTTFHNAFTFFETPISYNNNNFIFYCFEKFAIGIFNSFFLFLPTSISHLICLRRFVMQGLEAGYIAGLGIIAGNIIWIGSIIFGLRFLLIPWLSFDILRYLLGFMLLVKYMWDSTTKYEKKSNQVLEDLSKWKIFFLNFLLAFTEQTNIYPFISNLSISSDSTFFEIFPAETSTEFFGIHFFYLLGIFIGSYSLLQLICWFWENPAYNFYMWAISSGSIKITTSFYYKVLNFLFLYLTMICAISSVSYFGIDYTLTNPLGFVHEDRLTDQKGILETSFINTKASDRNTRRNRGRHGRRERWKRRIRRYRTFDASLYDQGTYDLFPIEDINYGFDKFWLRRKIRNHRVHFRFFPGPWMRSLKKQLSRPRLESFMGPRVEFFRILFEQVYHPEFHESSTLNKKNKLINSQTSKNLINRETSIYIKNQPKIQKQGLIKEHSALRKFVRKINNRIQSSNINFQLNNFSTPTFQKVDSIQPIYSKHWKHIFSKFSHQTNSESTILRQQENMFRRFYSKILLNKSSESNGGMKILDAKTAKETATKKYDSLTNLSKKDRQILRYKTFLLNEQLNTSTQKRYQLDLPNNKQFSKIEALTESSLQTNLLSKDNFQQNNPLFLDKKQNLIGQTTFSEMYKPFTLLHPLKFYLQKEKAFQKKFQFYGASVYRNFGIENNAPYFRTMMKRFFYYYKPTLRWERTMRTATMRKARRKGPRVVRKFNIDKKTQILSKFSENSQGPLSNSLEGKEEFSNEKNNIEKNFQKPTHFYSLINKRSTRYRYQIYKDVLQHWYYTPINRFLLKLDVDSFIRRQPSSYFLSKKEEQILHLHRLMLAEHYDTLRWYTTMEHYNSMKNRIGGTKSFASRAYLQQFQGTFKKVRHLFALTPSSSENTILKFDQPLYNEYSNTHNSPILNKSLFHEELLVDENEKTPTNIGSDLTSQSTQILSEYLKKASSIREEYRNKLLSEKNYWELTKFLYKGQKFRGSSAITNEHDYLNQEKNFLYTEKEQAILREKFKSAENFKNNNLWLQTLWIELFQKCQNTLYDQEALKQYLTKHVDKRRKKQQRQEKYLTLRLNRLENWFFNKNYQDSLTQKKEQPKNKEKSNQTFQMPKNSTGLSTAILKGIKESILFQKNLTSKTTKLNVRNNKPKIYLSLETLHPLNTMERFQNFKNHLMYRIQIKNQIVQKNQVEQDFKKLLKGTEFIDQVKGFKIQNESTTSLQTSKTLNFNTNIVNEQKHSNVKQKISNLYYLIKKTINVLKVGRPLKWISNQPFIFASKFQKKNKKQLNNIEDWKVSWRKQEIALTKRKKTRRILKRLKNTKERNRDLQISLPTSYFLKNKNNKLLSEKKDELSSFSSSGIQKSKKLFDGENVFSKRQKQDMFEKTSPYLTLDQNVFGRLKQQKDISTQSWKRWYGTNFETINKIGLFKKKRTRLRRNRLLKHRRPIKKRTLGEKFKRKLKLLKKYSRSTEQDKLNITRFNKKVDVFQMITKRKYVPQSRFKTRDIKQRRTRFLKRRFWRKHKKPKYAQDKRQQRKRRRYALGKIRTMNKDTKRIKENWKVKQWWWEKLLPNIKANFDAKWQAEMDQKIAQDFSNQVGRIQVSENNLQIGDKDYKPLSLPEAIHIGESLKQTPNSNNNFSNNSVSAIEKLEQDQRVNQEKIASDLNIVSQITNNIYSNSHYQKDSMNQKNSLPKIVNVNPIPFYAGWDETLRKFVITNRILSSKPTQEAPLQSNFSTIAPLYGMNAATTLYWQVPFTTYDPDQFFALGMDGFSPIGWRKFHFRFGWSPIHSTPFDFSKEQNELTFGERNSKKQTTKPILVQSQTFATTTRSIEKAFSENTLLSAWKKTNQENNKYLNTQTNLFDSQKRKLNGLNDIQNQLRRSQKRYKRVKKHPRPPVWFPSGPLTNQVLPVHYIYIFYKRYRLPRDRYIRRRFRQTKSTQITNSFSNILDQRTFTTWKDLTLRKRVKPRRKYHRTRHLFKTENLFIRRQSFRNTVDANYRERFSPPNFMSTLEQRTSLDNKKSQQRLSKKKIRSKQQADNLRIRQLRRRVQRQVLRPVWRYRPRAGGLTWPGDYLRLELVQAPVLTGLTDSNILVDQVVNKDSSRKRKTRKKKRRTIQEWQIQPKKYLLRKHNVQVLKKRLQKAHNSHKFDQRLKELNLLLK